MNRTKRLIAAVCRSRIITCLSVIFILNAGALRAASDDDLRRRATWTAPSIAQTQEQLFQWLESLDVDPEVRALLSQRWQQSEGLSSAEALELLIGSCAQIDGRIAELHEFCQRPRPAYELQPMSVTTD